MFWILFLQHKIMMGWENSCNSLNVSFTNTDTPLLIRLHRQFLFFCRILREFRGLPLWLVRYCRWRGATTMMARRRRRRLLVRQFCFNGILRRITRFECARTSHYARCYCTAVARGSRLTQPRPPTPAMYGAMCRLIREHWITWKGMHLSSNSWTLNDLNRCWHISFDGVSEG